MKARQIRRLLRWFGLCVFALCIAAWIAGQWYWIRIGPGRVVDVVIVGGTVGIDWIGFAIPMRRLEVHSLTPHYRTVRSRLGLYWPEVLARPVGSGIWGGTLPFWFCLLLVGVPTAVLWLRREPPEPGLCACGYDLSGNVSGVCPECGQAIPDNQTDETT
jgi:hypothetical protein